ncbi:MAG: lipopolysaccharide biosynthesis protein [Spirosomataceae bacterium]
MSIKNIIDRIRTDFLQIFGNYFQQIASIIFGIIIAKSVTPEAYGIFGLAVLVANYLKFFNLGAQYTINKRLSIRNSSWLAYNYMAFNNFLYPIVIGLVLYIIYYFELIRLLDGYYIYIWLYLISENMSQLIQGVARAKGLSVELGRSRLIAGLSVFFLIVLYSGWKNVENPTPLFIKWFIVPILSIIYFLFLPDTNRILILPRLKRYKYLKYFIIEGIFLGLYVFLQDVLAGIDRIFIGKYYSTYDLGLYSFAYSINGPILLALSTVMFMDYSRYMNKFRLSDSVSNSKIHLEILKKNLTIYLVFVFAGCIFSGLLLNLYLDEYKGAFKILILLLIAYLPSMLSYSYSIYFIANGMYSYIMKILFISILLSLILDFLVAFFNLNFLYTIVVSFFIRLFIYVCLRNKYNRSNVCDNL